MIPVDDIDFLQSDDKYTLIAWRDDDGKVGEALAFTSGQTSQSITVSITNDSLVESSETFGLIVQRNLADLATTFLVKSSFTIADDDTVVNPSYSLSPASVTKNVICAVISTKVQI